MRTHQTITVAGLVVSALVCMASCSMIDTTGSGRSKGLNMTDIQWLDSERAVRFEIEVDSMDYPRTDQVVEVDIDIDAMLQDAGVDQKVDADTLRVVEVDTKTGDVSAANVPAQYDHHRWLPGKLTIFMQGLTPAHAKRHYQAYFALEDQPYTPAQCETLITFEDNITDEDQQSYKVNVGNATFYYQKQGAGLSSLVDADGNDWIDYHPGNKDQGEWRGIANMGWDGLDDDPGFGHPGYTSGQSEIIANGPVKTTIRSWSNNGHWETLWDFFPGYARLTVLRKPPGRPYWFLYEGTPGGELKEDNLCVRAPGIETDMTEKWGEALPDPEWVYFGDRQQNRSIFLVHQDHDDHIDSYYQLRTMTVFGFGRGAGKNSLGNYLTQTPNRFLVGLAESIALDDVVEIIQGSHQPLKTTVGRIQFRIE